MNPRIRRIMLQPDTTVSEAMEAMTASVRQTPAGPSGIALIVDGSNTLLGILTDGDVRRFLLRGGDIAAMAQDAMNTHPFTLASTLTPAEMLDQVLGETKRRGLRPTAIEKIVIVSSDGKPWDVLSFFELWRQTDVATRTVAIIGLGYVGLTFALTLADFGLSVVGTDIDQSVLSKLRAGDIPFYERGLRELLRLQLQKGFRLTDAFHEHPSDVYVVCVGTPVDALRRPDLAALLSSVESVARVLKPYDLVILRSTVPVGTCRETVIPLIEKVSGLAAGKTFFFAFAPERTAEGRALTELRTLPQVIGGFDPTSAALAGKLFRLITPAIVPVGSLEEAELVKLLNNSYRDLIFSFANETSRFCHALGVNAHDVISAANQGYIRDRIPLPSPGVGGACLTKDPYLLAASAAAHGVTLELPIASRRINEDMIGHIHNRVMRFLDERRAGGGGPQKIFAMGMAFKGDPETSDVRYSTTVMIARALQKEGPDVFVHDAVASVDDPETKDLRFVSVDEGMADASAVLILNNHPAYHSERLLPLLDRTASPALLFDAWNMFKDVRDLIPGHIRYQSL
ncbi:MAG: nucleotide sugar dehydrogenase [Patescibacteria group bacterium]